MRWGCSSVSEVPSGGIDVVPRPISEVPSSGVDVPSGGVDVVPRPMGVAKWKANQDR